MPVGRFVVIVVNLEIQENDTEDPNSKTIEKYKNHPSISALKNDFPSYSFVFETVSRYEILKEIKDLGSSKITQESEILTKSIEENAELFADLLHPF